MNPDGNVNTVAPLLAPLMDPRTITDPVTLKAYCTGGELPPKFVMPDANVGVCHREGVTNGGKPVRLE